jgi:hypothetical protein
MKRGSQTKTGHVKDPFFFFLGESWWEHFHMWSVLKGGFRQQLLLIFMITTFFFTRGIFSNKQPKNRGEKEFWGEADGKSFDFFSCPLSFISHRYYYLDSCREEISIQFSRKVLKAHPNSSLILLSNTGTFFLPLLLHRKKRRTRRENIDETEKTSSWMKRRAHIRWNKNETSAYRRNKPKKNRQRTRRITRSLPLRATKRGALDFFGSDGRTDEREWKRKVTYVVVEERK